jgi:hypothetical protein
MSPSFSAATRKSARDREAINRLGVALAPVRPTAAWASRLGRRPSRTRAPRDDPIEHFSKQQLDLSHRQAFADQMTIDLKPKQAAGITWRLGLDHDSLEHWNQSPTSGIWK